MTLSDTISIVTAATGLVFGVIALILAFRANKISKEAHQLAKDAYIGERRIFLKSERRPEGLLLTASGDDQTINNITLFFPKKLGISPVVLAGANLILYDLRIQANVKHYWDSHTPLPNTGFAVVRQHSPLPVVALVHGHTKGVATLTTGFYDLYSQYVRYDNSKSELTIQALAFNNYNVSGKDPQSIADRILEEFELIIPSLAALEDRESHGS